MPNIQKKIIVLGANGFVGKNVALTLSKEYKTYSSSRTKELINTIYFDLSKKETWINVIKLDVDVIINCIGYGVVKKQQDVAQMFTTNYINTIAFYDYIAHHSSKAFIIHIGTAFEYDLTENELQETSSTLPLTYYGMSKYLTSSYLSQKFNSQKYIMLRPFNMFGSFEDDSKIIPSLILAQKEKKTLALSNGLQKRDYFHVMDLANFLGKLLKKKDLELLPKCINVGSGKIISIKELSAQIAPILPYYDSKLWNWGAIETRDGETKAFFNASLIASKLGFEVTDIQKKLEETVTYYWNL